jgi:hypothetical protein
MSRFELIGTLTAQVAVASRSIAKPLDVIRHVGRRQRAVLADLLLDPLFSLSLSLVASTSASPSAMTHAETTVHQMLGSPGSSPL